MTTPHPTVLTLAIAEHQQVRLTAPEQPPIIVQLHRRNGNNRLTFIADPRVRIDREGIDGA